MSKTITIYLSDAAVAVIEKMKQKDSHFNLSQFFQNKALMHSEEYQSIDDIAYAKKQKEINKAEIEVEIQLLNEKLEKLQAKIEEERRKKEEQEAAIHSKLKWKHDSTMDSMITFYEVTPAEASTLTDAFIEENKSNKVSIFKYMDSHGYKRRPVEPVTPTKEPETESSLNEQ